MPSRRRGIVGAALVLAACSPAPRASARPAAEFLLVSDDSTAWVRSSADTVVVQRAPLLIATLADRLIEIYLAEEAIDFEEASFLVSRVFRRDLVSGDSTLVFADSTVLRDVMQFVKTHPDAERLDEDEASREATRTVESGVTPLAVIGNTIGLEVHVDRTVGELGTHDTYRATIDLLTGRRLALAGVIGVKGAGNTMVAARQRFSAAIALAARREGPVGKEASKALAALILDSLSFSLTREGDSLAAVFLAHDEQVIDEVRDTHRFSLEPIALASPTWWRDARAPLPEQRPDSSSRFALGAIYLEVRYDGEEVGSISTRTPSATRPVTRMRGPVRWVIALGDSVKPHGQWRRALERAFAESGYYSDEVRAVSRRGRSRANTNRLSAL